MNAYEIMREWDKEAGIKPRTDTDYDYDVPGGLSSDYEDWKQRLGEGDVEAILDGRQTWGLPPFI